LKASGVGLVIYHRADFVDFCAVGFHFVFSLAGGGLHRNKGLVNPG
jgi:hypothetical protein